MRPLTVLLLRGHRLNGSIVTPYIWGRHIPDALVFRSSQSGVDSSRQRGQVLAAWRLPPIRTSSDASTRREQPFAVTYVNWRTHTRLLTCMRAPTVARACAYWRAWTARPAGTPIRAATRPDYILHDVRGGCFDGDGTACPFHDIDGQCLRLVAIRNKISSKLQLG